MFDECKVTHFRHLCQDAAVSGGLEMRGVSANEDAHFEERVKVMKEFMGSERFKYTTRPYKVPG